MPPRALLAVAGWTAAAVAATLTGLAAVQVIGDGIAASTDGGVLTPEQVERQLASATASPSAEQSTGSPTPTPTAAPTTQAPSTTAVKKTLSTPGGTAIAECNGSTVRLLSWAPAQGFGVKRADRGPDEHAEVIFEGAGGKVEMRVRCTGGQPTASWKQDD
ncbi:hypothetical protein ABT009_45775 [Streptomyces sp. NPDC002896]|uniref:hypothetical protein n=1 Tax=Streptomyces sp. NPDC002896 TaxID=3154438 RepID=UPI003317ED89